MIKPRNPLFNARLAVGPLEPNLCANCHGFLADRQWIWRGLTGGTYCDYNCYEYDMEIERAEKRSLANLPDRSLLTPEAYALDSGMHCPACRSPQVSGEHINIEEGKAYQEMSCLTCPATWTDVYQLQRYVDLDTGE